MLRNGTIWVALFNLYVNKFHLKWFYEEYEFSIEMGIIHLVRSQEFLRN